MKVTLLKIMMATVLLLTACNGISNNTDYKKDKEDDQPAVETAGEGQEDQNEQMNEENTEEKEDDSVNLASEFLNDIKVEDGVNYIQNPENILVLVNKEYSLPVGYRADDLVKPNVKFSFSGENEKQLMRKEAAEALEKMFTAASTEGVELAAVSGFRSYERQVQIYNAEIAASGMEYAQQAVAEPGKSEHQTGLTMDVSSGDNNYQLNQEFGNTAAGKWLEENSAEYGFIIRYPKDGEKITGYMYEPWHIRYVGKAVATDLKMRNLTLEEYIQLATE